MGQPELQCRRRLIPSTSTRAVAAAPCSTEAVVNQIGVASSAKNGETNISAEFEGVTGTTQPTVRNYPESDPICLPISSGSPLTAARLRPLLPL